jgi:hypothetical protein
MKDAVSSKVLTSGSRTSSPPGFFECSYVFPNDAEDIKSHRWFRGFDWDGVMHMTPPFVPQISTPEDTKYFDEEEPVSDMSSAASSVHREDSRAGGGDGVRASVEDDPTPEEIRTALEGFSASMQAMALQFVANPYDSVRLRQIDVTIDATTRIGRMEKEVLKQFVRLYGRKERKRPRDKLLRDPKTRRAVMEVRKETAFMGYTWRRRRPHPYMWIPAAGGMVELGLEEQFVAGGRPRMNGKSWSYL